MLISLPTDHLPRPLEKRKEHRPESHTDWIQILNLPLTGFGFGDNCVHLSELQFPRLQKRCNKTDFSGYFCR